MSLERGGKADKDGNRYEYEWILYNVLEVINNDIQSFIWEPIGPDADGVDVTVITNHNDYQQCKASNGDRDYWRLSDLMSNKILDRWKSRLSENAHNEVSLVSPLTFKGLSDLITRARNSNNIGTDFYEYQIEKAGIETKKLFDEIFRIFTGLLEEVSEEDYNQVLSFLKRMNIRTYSWEGLHEFNLMRIENLFLTNREEVYRCLLKCILDRNNYSHKIDANTIKKWLELDSLQLRNLRSDGQTIGKVMALNEQFKDKFLFWSRGFIDRDCYHDCLKKLNDAIVTIVHGEAGVGKSGAVYGLIREFERLNRPFIAISVENCVPEKSVDTWSREKLNLPINVVNVIDQLFKNDSPVIILDQFDTMRWRSTNYSEAYSICRTIIKQVEELNKTRKEHPIRIVLVTRTYDLEHNEFLRSLCIRDNYLKFEILQLTNEEIYTIIGEDFTLLDNRTKLLLRRFINLYIWNQIQENQDDREKNFKTQSQLIYKWFSQVKCHIHDSIKCSDKEIIECNKKFIDYCKSQNTLNVPTFIMESYETIMNQFASEGFFVCNQNHYSYVHQSIFDYFIASDMLGLWLNGKSIEEVIGGIDSQTPWRRYQIQMMFDQLYEISTDRFLFCGKSLLASDGIRFYIKYVFFETLGKLERIDANLESYISEQFFDTTWGVYLEDAIKGNLEIVELLINSGILEQFIFEKGEIDRGIALLQSVDCNKSLLCTNLINKIYYKLPENRSNISFIFYKDWIKDCDSFFDLRMEYYNEYWDTVSIDIMLEQLVQKNFYDFSRLIKLISIGVLHDATVNFSYVECTDLQISISQQELKDLIDIIPIKLNRYKDRDWIANPLRMTYKRLLVELIKSSLVDWCNNDEQFVWQLIARISNQDNYIYNEITLWTFTLLSSNYSDRIFEYFCDNLRDKVFEYSSTCNTYLDLVTVVVTKHVWNISQQLLNRFLSLVIKYTNKELIKIVHNERLKSINRYQFNVYNSYWGAFQYIFFNCIDSELLTDEYKAIKLMLNRMYPNGISLYNKSRITSGFVNSSIPFNNLSLNAWKKLLCNQFIDNKGKTRLNKSGLLIENSTSTIIGAVANRIEDKTKQFLELIISCGKSINIKYVETAVVKLTDEQVLSKLSDIELFRFIKYILEIDINPYAKYLFEIITKRPELYLYDEVKGFVKYFCDKDKIERLSDYDIISFDLTDSFWMQEVNSIKGRFINLFCILITQKYVVLEDWETDILSILSAKKDFDLYLYGKILIAEYSLNKSIGKSIVKLLLEHYNVLNIEYGLSLLWSLYNDGYQNEVKTIIRNCYLSLNDDLVRLSSYFIVDMYMRDVTSTEVYFNDVETLNSNGHLLDMMELVNVYFSNEAFREKAKLWYINLMNQGLNISHGVANLFYQKLLSISQDYDFIKDNIFAHNVNRQVLREFIEFLKDDLSRMIAASDIVISIIRFVVDHRDEQEYMLMSHLIDELLADLYEASYKINNVELQRTCLDLWDNMYKYRVGSMRVMMDKVIQ